MSRKRSNAFSSSTVCSGFHRLLARQIQSRHDHFAYRLESAGQIRRRILYDRRLQLGLVVGFSRSATVRSSTCVVVQCHARDASGLLVKAERKKCFDRIFSRRLLVELITRKPVRTNRISPVGRKRLVSIRIKESISSHRRHSLFTSNIRINVHLKTPMADGPIFVIDNYV